MLLGHRYYEPETGRFLTRDPIKDGRNWYEYCGGRPLNGADHNGLQKHIIVDGDNGGLVGIGSIPYIGWNSIWHRLVLGHEVYIIEPKTRENFIDSCWDADSLQLSMHGGEVGGAFLGEGQVSAEVVLEIIKRRRQHGLPRMKVVNLDYCFSLKRQEAREAWAELADEVYGWKELPQSGVGITSFGKGSEAIQPHGADPCPRWVAVGISAVLPSDGIDRMRRLTQWQPRSWFFAGIATVSFSGLLLLILIWDARERGRAEAGSIQTLMESFYAVHRRWPDDLKEAESDPQIRNAGYGADTWQYQARRIGPRHGPQCEYIVQYKTFWSTYERHVTARREAWQQGSGSER